MKGFIGFLVLIAIVVGSVYVYLNYFSPDEEAEEEVQWVTYTNDEFDFKIDHPENWQVLDFSDNEISPVINIVKNDEDQAGPFIHHNNVTQVSMFPNGYPTEGVFGETKDSSVELSEPVRAANDFILGNGMPWATFVVFRDNPPSWDEPGFMWASVEIQNGEAVCTRDGEEIDENTCDPFFGDVIIRRGDISQEDREIEERMMESFQFTEESVRNNLIRVFSPEENSVISNPLIVRGEARGTWYFEATFPVTLVNWDGLIIAETYAEAQDNWMTEEFVPFEAQVIFDKPEYGATGALILQKSNPSGLPEHDDAIEIPIRFE